LSDEKFIEVTVEEFKNKHAYVRCHTCNKDGQNAEIMASVSKHGQENCGGGNYVDWWERYQVLKCGGCETIFFRTTQADSEDVDFDYGHNGEAIANYNVAEKVYPEVATVRAAIKGFHLLPDQLQAIYIEASRAMHANQPILAGIGIRAILETICKDKAAIGSNLFKQIDGLKTQGVLSPNGAIVLHKLRVLGNSAAHEVKPHTDDQLSLAFDVLDNLLLNVYVLEPQAATIFP
jgi:hypothetical protein